MNHEQLTKQLNGDPLSAGTCRTLRAKDGIIMVRVAGGRWQVVCVVLDDVVLVEDNLLHTNGLNFKEAAGERTIVRIPERGENLVAKGVSNLLPHRRSFVRNMLQNLFNVRPVFLGRDVDLSMILWEDAITRSAKIIVDARRAEEVEWTKSRQEWDLTKLLSCCDKVRDSDLTIAMAPLLQSLSVCASRASSAAGDAIRRVDIASTAAESFTVANYDRLIHPLEDMGHVSPRLIFSAYSWRQSLFATTPSGSCDPFAQWQRVVNVLNYGGYREPVAFGLRLRSENVNKLAALHDTSTQTLRSPFAALHPPKDQPASPLDCQLG